MSSLELWLIICCPPAAPAQIVTAQVWLETREVLETRWFRYQRAGPDWRTQPGKAILVRENTGGNDVSCNEGNI